MYTLLKCYYLCDDFQTCFEFWTVIFFIIIIIFFIIIIMLINQRAVIVIRRNIALTNYF